MSDIELIENLTQIVEAQAALIRKLHFQNKQLLTVSSMDDEVESLLAKTDKTLNEERLWRIC
jgi:hypothetical protein